MDSGEIIITIGIIFIIAALIFCGVVWLLQWLINDAFLFLHIDIYLNYWQTMQLVWIFSFLCGSPLASVTAMLKS